MDRALATRLGVGLLAGLGILGQACGDSASGGAGGSASDQSSSATTKSTSTKATAASTPTVDVSASTGMPQDALGAACEADADCGADYTCMKSSDTFTAVGLGGPAGGYCTKTCVNTPDCGPGNYCVGTGADKRCIAGCEIGVPEMEFLDSPLDETKCHGRADTPCFDRTAGAVCRPICQSDAECGGRSCDKSIGLCVDTPRTGTPLGSECDPEGANTCEGICVSFTDGGSFCSSYCTFGGEDLNAECGGLAAGLCLFASTGHELGDQAFCTAACTAHDECQNPLLWCFPIGGLEDNGFCAGATDCPGGQGDCAMAMGTTCTQTSFGPKCLNPMYPLTGEGGGSSSSASSSASASSSSSASGTGGAGGN